MKCNIVLCGFMGSGKSTIGKELAKHGFNFVDSDDYIEKNAGKSISKIFETHGEAYFRALEAEAVKELSKKTATVIATGGGVVMNPENVTALKSTGILVFLDVTPQTVLTRLEGDTTRPLLMRPDRETAVNDLIKKRAPVYRSVSDVTVDANGDVLKTVKIILDFVKKNQT